MDGDPSVSVSMPTLPPHVPNDNDEVVLRHKVPGSSGSYELRILPQLGFHILREPSNLESRRRAWIDGDTSIVNNPETSIASSSQSGIWQI